MRDALLASGAGPVADVDPFRNTTEHLTSTTSVVGIDLGTTFSCVSVWQDGKVEIIPDQFGSRVMPSYVAFTGDQWLVGEEAYNQVCLMLKQYVVSSVDESLSS